jgi:hypothetical protein
MLLLARASGAVPSRLVTAAPSSPHGFADQALQLAATGNLGAAFGFFSATNFPQPKQEDFVREAYFELQVQNLLNLVTSHQCPQADRGITNLGYEDKNLPFSFIGFGPFAKRLRVQYLLGTVEAACVDEKSARKRWEKVAKASADMASTDYPYPYLAMAKLNPEGAPDKIGGALEAVNRALASANPDQRPLLLYHQGMLRVAMGQSHDAGASFSEGARTSTGIVRYLNLDALRGLTVNIF